jgi:hypothetical protein
MAWCDQGVVAVRTKIFGIVLTAAALLLRPALAQQTQPNLANAPDVVQWSQIDSNMADLLKQGYRLVSVTQVITNPPVQDVMTTYFLAKDSDLVRCQEGFRLISEKYWVSSCSRIAVPYQIKNN